MVELEGNVVATYKFPHCTVRIRDSAYINKTPEEIAEVRRNVSRVCSEILLHAVIVEEQERLEAERLKREAEENNQTQAE